MHFTSHAEIHGKINQRSIALKRKACPNAPLSVFVPDFLLSLVYEKAECLAKTIESLMLQLEYSCIFSFFYWIVLCARDLVSGNSKEQGSYHCPTKK